MLETPPQVHGPPVESFWAEDGVVFRERNKGFFVPTAVVDHRFLLWVATIVFYAESILRKAGVSRKNQDLSPGLPWSRILTWKTALSQPNSPETQCLRGSSRTTTPNSPRGSDSSTRSYRRFEHECNPISSEVRGRIHFESGLSVRTGPLQPYRVSVPRGRLRFSLPPLRPSTTRRRLQTGKAHGDPFVEVPQVISQDVFLLSPSGVRNCPVHQSVSQGGPSLH